MKITSLQNPYIRSLFELQRNKEKKARGLFLVDGLDFLEMAHRKGLLLSVLYAKEPAPFDGVEQIGVTDAIIRKLSVNRSPSDYIGVCRYPEEEAPGGETLVYLDGVQDPGNVGTIIRTALAFNYGGVALSPDSASLYNDKVISATKGAIFSIPVHTSVSLEELKRSGYTIIASALSPTCMDYRRIPVPERFVLVLGSEGSGVKESTLHAADFAVKIPISGIDSLNVAAAAAVLMNAYRKDDV